MRWAAAGCLTALASDPADPAELGDMADFMMRHVAADADADLTDVALAFAADREHIHSIPTADRKDFDRDRSPAGKQPQRL